jgi:hypothetical protein
MIEKGGRKTRFFDHKDRLLKGKQKSSHNNANNGSANNGNGPELSSRVPGSRSIAQLAKAKSTSDDMHMLNLLAACFKWNPRYVTDATCTGNTECNDSLML